MLFSKAQFGLIANTIAMRFKLMSLRTKVLFAAVTCLVIGVMLATMPGSAATPSSGTLTDVSGPLFYDAGPFNVANATPVPQLDSGPECGPGQPCDNYALTVTLPGGYHAAHPNAAIKVTLSWVDTGSGASDYDLYIYKGTVINTDGSQAADYQSAGGANPEVATISPVSDGTKTFSVKVVPYTPTGETVHVKIELLPGSGGGGGTPGFGGPDPTTPGVPRYQNFYAPAGSSAETSDGEFNIGFNPHTGRIMTMNIGPIWRLTPGEVQTPSKPECCEALWEDKSSTATDTGVDPILFTDQKTGRTFASNFTGGANAIYSFSDNDGDLWVPLGGSPPNGGADHETIGSGPYPAALSALSNPVNQGEAVYYCSQTIVGPAFCQRSDDLGASYGPGVPAYTGITTACGGLHGHVHVAPDGTAWLPVNQCNGKQGGAVSTDGGITWNEFIVSGSLSQSNGADPSVAIDSDSTAYYCYVNNEPVAVGNPPEGHVHVKVSKNGGKTWIHDFDLGASHGIKNAVHTEAIGGSSGRASCGFIGTDIAGDYQASSFPGKWYAFIATTYDGGLTWVTVNATPNDPVQSMTGVWQQGGSHDDRNLLDFNEITVDNKGRVLYGYSDGCVSEGCIGGTAGNDFVAFMRVARQFGGKGLFANLDTPEPVAPKPPCLSGTRDPAASHLTWKIPDNGGSDITGYQILRGTSAGNETVLVPNTGNIKTTYNDTTANPAVPDYFYVVKAINANGTGLQSNEIDLTVVAPPPPENVCELPGLKKLTDPAGDTSAALGIINTPAPPGSDLLKFQIAQPYAADNVIKLAFTITTDNGQSLQPTGSAWYVAMKIAGNDPPPAPQTGFHYRGVHMAWNPTSPTMPTFESYTPSPNSGGGVDGRFVKTGSQIPAEASSSYASPFDKVVIVVKASDLGLNPGDTMSFVSGVSQSTDPGAIVGAGATALYDQMPDSLSFTGTFTVNNNQVCRPNTCPVAVLNATTPTSGNAPLTVGFSGAGSSDPDTAAPPDTIASYTFNFGDGSPEVTQTTPTISHTYNTPGSFNATLRVTDSRGLVSCNTAQVVISVSGSPPPPQCVEDDDPSIIYDNGWHTIKDSNASFGHFRLDTGKDVQHALKLTFQDNLQYFFAKSTKGGTAQVAIDGVLLTNVTINYQASAGMAGSGSMHDPFFKDTTGTPFSVTYSLPGTHTFELVNLTGPAYVDKFCTTNTTSSTMATAGPGTTMTSTSALAIGQSLLQNIVVPSNALGFAVAAEANINVPYTLVVIDPSGRVLGTVNSSSNGIASVSMPVSTSGLYAIKLVNVGVGPVNIWTAATPFVQR